MWAVAGGKDQPARRAESLTGNRNQEATEHFSQVELSFAQVCSFL